MAIQMPVPLIVFRPPDGVSASKLISHSLVMNDSESSADVEMCTREGASDMGKTNSLHADVLPEQMSLDELIRVQQETALKTARASHGVKCASADAFRRISNDVHLEPNALKLTDVKVNCVHIQRLHVRKCMFVCFGVCFGMKDRVKTN
jgi:hypothetical protein